MLKKSIDNHFFKIFAIALIFYSSLLPAFSPKVIFAEPEYEEAEHDNGKTRNETEGREYDRANVDKRVTWSGENPGEYFIDLTIEGKTVKSDETTDIVLVYDNSNSMDENNRVGIARDATTSFVNSLLSDSNNFQIGLITYGTVVFDGRLNNVLNQPGATPNMSYKGLTNGASNITSLLPNNTPTVRGRGNDGGTFTQQGLEEAGKILANSTADNKIIVTLTDGVPTVSYQENGSIVGTGSSYVYPGGNHGNNTIREANQLKQSYELYTIAIEIGGGQGATREQAEQLMRDISSSPDHAYFASNVDQLIDHLNDIARNLSGSIVDGSVVDPMGEMFNLKGADNFTLASNENLTDGNYYLSASNPALLNGVTVSTDGQTINMNGLNLGAGEEITLRYKVQIDTDNPNFEADTLYRTNGETTLTPRSSTPDDKNIFPEPEASATGITVTGEKIWEDHGLEDRRPDNIEVILMRDINGTPIEVDNGTVEPDENGNWVYRFPNQIKFDSQGNDIDYYVKEIEVPGYETTYSDDGLVITNILISNPEISLEKNANRDDLVVGEEIEYTFTVVNTGNLELKDVHIVDTLENISAIEYLTINGEPITNSDSIALQPDDVLVAKAIYTITQADVDNGQVENFATVTGTSSTTNEEVTDEDEAKVPQELNPKISLVKTSNLDEISEVEQEVTYTFEVTNTGNVTLHNIQLTDPMLGGEITLAETTLAPGESTTGTATYEVTQEDLNNGGIDNIATVTAEDPKETPVEDDDEDNLPANQIPAISLEKEANRNNLVAGEDINYTFTATNTGNVTLKNVQITDILEGISNISYLTINGETIDDTESITLEPGDVLSAEASYTITQADVDRGQVYNHATVTGNAPNDEEVTDDDQAAVPHDPNVDISLEKTGNLVEVTEAGQVIEYTFTVTNTGDVTLTDIVVNDPMIDAEIVLESTTLAPGETTTGTATYEVTEADLENGNITNVATVTGNPPNPEDEPPIDEGENIIPVGSINLVKTSNVDAITEVGQVVTYTFEVTNTGEVTLNDVQVNDPMLGGEITLAETTLAPGESTIGTAVYVVTHEDIDNEGITNTATTTGTTPEDTTVEDEDTDDLGKASIDLVKTSNLEEITEVEQEVTYMFEVTNTGNVTLENVQVNDPMLDGEIILEKTTLAPGESTTGTAVYVVTQADLNNGGITNTATTTGETPEGTPVEDEDEDELPASQDPDISLVKSADKEGLVVGEEIKYTFTATNTGNVTLNNVQITDLLEGLSEIRYLSINGEPIDDAEEGLSFALNLTKAFLLSSMLDNQSSITLEPGDVLVAEATYIVTQADVDRGELENTATVVGTSPSDEEVTDEDTVIIEQDSNPSISLEKLSDVEEVTEVGQVITYTFTVENTGDVTLTDLELNDPMLGGKINLESTTLAPGETTTGTAKYTVTQEDLDKVELVNVASVEGTPPGYDPEDPDGPEKPRDEDEDRVPTNQDPAISLVKEADRNDLVAGENITYTFTATNTGNVTLTNVTIEDMLEGISDIRYLTVNDEELEDAESITLEPSDVLVAEATYTITQTDVDTGQVVNYATVTGNDPKDEPVTDEDEALVPHDQGPAINLEKTSDAAEVTEVGQVITYTFTVENTGDVTLTDLELNDPMLGGKINLETTTLAPGKTTTGTAEYTVTQADLDKEELVNLASIEGTPPGYDPEDPDGPEKPRDEDEDRVPTKQEPAISLEKSSDVASISEVGETVVYNFQVTNTGNVTLTDLELNDPMLGGSIELETTTLAPGATTTGTATYEVTQADLDKEALENLASVEGTPPGYDPEDPDGPEKPRDEDEDRIPTDQEPAISLVKEADREDLVAGENITYTFTVTNTGNVTLTNVTLTDVLEGISDISYLTINDEDVANVSNITLEPGDVLVAEATYMITQADVDSGVVENKATVTGTAPDDEEVTDEDEVQVPQELQPSLSLEKSSNVESISEVGETVVYTFEVTNTGNVTLTDLVLNDPMLGGKINLETTTLAPGATTTGTAEYTVTQADLDKEALVNLASVEGTPPGYDPEDPDGPEKPRDEDEDRIPTDQKPAISLEKSSDVEEVTQAGEEIQFTFTVENTGNVTLTDVKVDDPMLAELGIEVELETTTLAPGETTTGSAIYTVTQEDMDNGGVVNVATATGTPPDPEDPNPEDPDEEEVPGINNPAISLEKSSDVEEVTQAGDQIEFTFTVTNTGNVTLTDVKVDDPMLAELGIEVELGTTTLAPGETTTGSAIYTVTQEDMDNGGVVNVATATGTPPNPEDPDPEDPDEREVPGTNNPAISLVKEADREDLVTGKEIGYRFTATNTGNVTLTNVTIEDMLEGISDISYLTINEIEITDASNITLQPGDVLVAEATYTITQADVDSGLVENKATVTGTAPDDEKVMDEDEVQVPQELQPSLSLEKSSNVESISKVGETIVYTFEVTNTGNVTLTDLVLDDPRLGGNIELETITLAPGASTTVTVEYVVTQADLDKEELVNVAMVEGTPPGYDPEDPDGPEKPRDEDEDSVPTDQDPAISLVKEADREDLVTGEDINYTFTVTNTGNVTLTNVMIEDVLEGISDISYSTINEEAITDVSSITLQPGDVLVAQASYTITQGDVNAGLVENTATVKGTAPNEKQVTDEDQVQVPQELQPSLSLEKSSDVDTISKVGDTINYTFEVTNTGNVTLTEIVLDDPMLGGKIDLETTSLAPGATTTVTVEYVVTQADLDKEELVNQASVEGTPPGYDPEDPNGPNKPREEDEDRIPTNQNPSINLVKSSDVETLSQAGEEVNYTFTVTNTGNVTLTDVTINDPMLEDLGIEIALEKSTLVPGETTTGSATYVVTQADIDNKGITNVATVTGDSPIGEKVSDKDKDVITEAGKPDPEPSKPMDPKEDPKEKLPKTATDMFNLLAIGLGLLILGMVLTIYRRKRERN